MHFMRELYNALLSGHHSGKAIKLAKRGQYEEALSHYNRALLHEGRSGTGSNPATLECIARTYARLGKLKEALAAAEQSYDLYKALNSTNNLILQSITRAEHFIAALKSENEDDLNKMLTA